MGLAAIGAGPVGPSLRLPPPKRNAPATCRSPGRLVWEADAGAEAGDAQCQTLFDCVTFTQPPAELMLTPV